MKFAFVLCCALPGLAVELTSLSFQQDPRYLPAGTQLRLRGFLQRIPQLGQPVCAGTLTLSVNGQVVQRQPSPTGTDFDFQYQPLSSGWQEILLEYRDPRGICAPARVRDIAYSGVLGAPYYRVWPADRVVRIGEVTRMAGVLPPGTPALIEYSNYTIDMLGHSPDYNSLTILRPPFYDYLIPHGFRETSDRSLAFLLRYAPAGLPPFSLASFDMRFLLEGSVRLETLSGETTVNSSNGLELMASFDQAPRLLPNAETVWYDGNTVLQRGSGFTNQAFLRLGTLAPGRHLLRVEMRGVNNPLNVNSNVLVLDVNPQARISLSASPLLGGASLTETDRVLLSARVEVEGRPAAAGEVEFLLRSGTSAAQSLGRATIREGIARWELNNLVSGSYQALARLVPAGGIVAPESSVEFRVESGLSLRNSASGAELLAPNALASLYGRNLSSESIAAIAPVESLGGVRLEFEDPNGRRSAAKILYVSPGQLNFLVPEGLPPGRSPVHLTLSGRNPIRLQASLAAASPGIFTVDGAKVPAALLTVRRRDGNLVQQFAFRCLLAEPCRAEPLRIPTDAEEAVLTLYATGLRAQAASVLALLGDQNADVLFAGAQPEFLGLDQVNLRLPLSLRQRGTLPLLLRTREAASNIVELTLE